MAFGLERWRLVTGEWMIVGLGCLCLKMEMKMWMGVYVCVRGEIRMTTQMRWNCIILVLIDNQKSDVYTDVFRPI